METEMSGDIVNDLPVVPSVKILDEEGNVLDKGISATDAEETGNKMSNSNTAAQSSKPGNVAQNKSKKITSTAANGSKEKQPSSKPKTKTRVVQSRFLSSLSNSKNNSSNSKSGNDSNNSKNSLNCTISGPTSISDTASKNRLARGASQKPGVGKSMSNIARAAENALKNGSSAASRPRPAKSALNLNEYRPNSGAAGPKSVAGKSALRVKPSASDNGVAAKYKVPGSGSSKLHSTVLAERTMLGGTQNVFSTTLVGGVEPGKANLISTKVCDVTQSVIQELPELPDISAIRLDSSGGDKSDVTILSPNVKNSCEITSIECLKEVTYQDLVKEHLRYLQGSYIDVMTEEAFNHQVKELQTQLVFLDQLVSEKQAEVTERKQKLELLKHHQKVYQTYKDQKDLLCKLEDGLTETESALEILSKECEKILHHVKLENVYIPTDHEEYRDQLSGALKEMNTCLSELDSILDPRSHQLTCTVGLLDDLKENLQYEQQCEREVNQAASLSIQEASLKIVAKEE